MTSDTPETTSKILCIDDDETIKIYDKYLGGAGYEIFKARDVDSGLRMTREERPDLILCDVILPGGTGVDLCRQVKDDDSLGTVIFILVSAEHSDTQAPLAGIESGADDYLYKPIRPGELLAKIKAFLRIKALQDELLISNIKLNKALHSLKLYKLELEKKNAAISKEKEMLENSLRQISLMVAEREKTNQELERLNSVQTDTFNGMTSLLSATIESKRQYHRGHSKKVSEISKFIATKLGLDPTGVRDVEIASLLHEIGKLSIPDDLAMKNPKDYTRAEKDFLSRHPVEGAAVLEKFPGFQSIARIIRHFHEHVDGNGTPDGLRRKAIPIGSRIIAAANLYDNLVYRKKDGSVENAFAIIEEQIGQKLDGKIVYYLHQYAAMHPVKTSEQAKAVKLYELKPGMQLAAGIYSLSGAKLLPIDTVLSEEQIRHIAQYNKREPIQELIFIR